jgi:hypothetical protein
MNLDLQIEGRYSQRTEDIQHLKQIPVEFELPLDAPSEHAVSVFKALVITLALFFSLATIIFMQPAMAFIYVTLILSGGGSMVVGSEKIIRILPERLWKN